MTRHATFRDGPRRLAGCDAPLPADCAACPLRDAELCRILREETPRGPRARVRRHFARDQRIVDQAARPAVLGVITGGYARQGQFRLDGGRVLLGLAGSGDVIGALPGTASACFVEAATEVDVCLFDMASIGGLMQDSVRFRRLVVQETDRQHHRLLDAIWRNGTLDSRERIIAFLVAATGIMPTEQRADGSLLLTLEVPRRDWADLTNTAVETISRTLRYLADKGMVQSLSRQRFLIRDIDLLAHLAGVDPPARLAEGGEPTRRCAAG